MNERFPDGSRPAVWLVDDSPLQAELSRRTLSTAFDIVVFHEASAMLERFVADERPEVLILDWHMPEVSGLDVCGVVRSLANGTEVPILVLTATGTPEDLLIGMRAGANDFVTKPFVPAELILRVTSLVRGRRLHQTLAATQEALREEAAFREKFMAILAHDLRQPLNVFVMGSGLFADQAPAGDRLGAMTKRFSSAASRMQRMLDELLDFSRIRHHGGMTIERRPGDIAEIAGRVVEEIVHANPDRRVVLDVTGECAAEWDSDRIAQIFSNLIGNALEHSAPPSAVRVIVRGDRLGVDIIVENECAPIPTALLATIFDPFRQGTKSGSRGGLGLGLYIVDQLARAHGGSVTAESNDERTRFVARVMRAG